MIDRVFGNVPDFHDGDTGAHQNFARHLGMHRAGDHYGVGSALHHGADDALFLLQIVHGVTDQQLVVGRAQRIGEPLSAIGEVGVGERRQDGGDEIGTAGGKRSGDSIRHITELLDGLHHLLACLFRHQRRIGQHPRDGHLGDAREFRDVAHGSFF
ncbi:hypothetical protein D3C72_1224790 [compost metagenome]